MPKIVDPDQLNQEVEVQFLTGSLQIKLNTAGNLSTDGVSLQTLYSFIKEEWKNDDNLIKFPFPMVSITTEQFEFIAGWDLSGSATISALDDTNGSWTYIRDGGWAVVNTAGDNTQEWMNITTLGAFDNSATDNAYYYQATGSAVRDIVLPGEVNQGIQIYSSGSIAGEEFDYRNFFKIYLREFDKVYAFYDLITEQNISALTYRKFALPLSNTPDLNFDTTDDTITGSSPYTGMSITYFTESFQRSIGGTNFDFKVLIDGNSGTKQQIYEFVQKQLRSGSGFDIDDGFAADPVTGSVAEELLEFVGSTLKTKFQNSVAGDSSISGGVYIDNFQAVDTNDLRFVDDTETERNFPFVAAGTIELNDNLETDADGIYKIFFTNDDTGDNSGRDFGTQNAILIQDNNGDPITGSTSGSSSIQFDYDYDGNIQRGSDSTGSAGTGTLVPFTGVALGLSSAQYVSVIGTITRTTSNTINFVSALERNYSNPA